MATPKKRLKMRSDAMTPEKFWERVEKTDTCWWWRGQEHNGYGRIKWHGKEFRAHRIAWELLRGPITEQTLDYLCRNTMCVNPAHLEPVTVRINTLRGVGPAALNAKKTHCPAGHEYTAENTYVKYRRRICQTCRRARRRAWMRRKRARAA